MEKKQRGVHCICEEAAGDDPQIMGLGGTDEDAVSIDGQHGAQAVMVSGKRKSVSLSKGYTDKESRKQT